MKNEWSISDINYLKAHYNTKSLKELATKLNKSESNIVYKAQMLGVSKKKVWSEKDEVKLIEIYNTMPLDEVASELNTNIKKIKSKVDYLRLNGVKFKKYKRILNEKSYKKYNRYDNLLSFSKEQGYNNVAECIWGKGLGTFKEEFKKWEKS